MYEGAPRYRFWLVAANLIAYTDGIALRAGHDVRASHEA